jgi:CheY-like chemotaxis protein
MILSKIDIKDKLKDNNVLIVEDDADLAERLGALIEKYTGKKPVVKKCCNGKSEGGLDELISKGNSYDIIIVDVRIPKNEASLKIVEESTSMWETLQYKIMEYENAIDDAEAQEELETLWKKQEMHEIEIRKNIDPEAGITMIEGWVADYRGKNEGNLPSIPVLYLSSRTYDRLAEKVKNAHGPSGAIERLEPVPFRWLSKPASPDLILSTMANLLPKKQI